MKQLTQVLNFEQYMLLEKKGDLKKLVGKEQDEELTVQDAAKLGKKIGNMEGQQKKKYVGIINFLGASCRIYNTIWGTYKKVTGYKKKEDKV